MFAGNKIAIFSLENLIKSRVLWYTDRYIPTLATGEDFLPFNLAFQVLIKINNSLSAKQLFCIDNLLVRH